VRRGVAIAARQAAFQQRLLIDFWRILSIRDFAKWLS
jgi:hypothetical protein